MDRKNFIKRSLLGLFGAASGGAILKAQMEEHPDTKPEQVGFNHLPTENPTTGNMVLHRANTRGHADHGWLNSYHSFSFANYYDPNRMQFGALRVLNDDTVAGGRGFGMHAHDNMEIISIPLEGDLQHKDSMGNVGVIRQGDIQVMSAGTGIQHSEYNHHADKPVKFLQIWVLPNRKNVSPRYDQITLDQSKLDNTLYQILSPNPDDQGVWIHQRAWFHLGNLKQGLQKSYRIKHVDNGVYAFVIEGQVNINGQDLNRRDGLGIWDVAQLDIQATTNTKLLLIDIPVK